MRKKGVRKFSTIDGKFYFNSSPVKENVNMGIKYQNYDLTKSEIDICRDNFQFLDRDKRGTIYRFKLPTLLKSNSQTKE